MAKSAAQVKRDLEHAYVGTAGTKSAGSASTASTMSGVQQQLDSSTVSYMGASTALSEAGLIAALQVAYNNGAEPSRIMVTPSNSVVLAGFASAAGRYRTITGGDAKTIVNAVNLYISPFGEQRVELNRFMRAKNTFVYEPEQWNKVILRPWERKNLAKTGDSTKAMLLGEFSLKHKNAFASALIVDNATSGF
jgi:hypothetical protein